MNNERKGEWYMLLLALFESWFPIVIIFAYAFIEPIFAYAINGIIAALFFVGVILYKKSFGEYRNIQGYRDLLLTAFFITLLFLFVFTGLKFTSASNMAVILFMQLFFSFFYFYVIGAEPIDRLHLVGAFLMGAGAVVILFPKNWHFNIGDLLVLFAAMIAPIANYYQKRSRKYFSAHAILAFRYIVSIPFLLLLAFVFEPMPSSEQFLSAMPYLVVSGFLVMGLSKIFWVEAIYLISITKASAMAAITPVLTIFFAYLFLDEVPTAMQLVAMIPIIAGGYLITREIKPAL
ncbi:MAG: DMT family transporter [Campylobacterales bacterium]|nr:DMT family transporter [Campylobacterales bacterium]